MRFTASLILRVSMTQLHAKANPCLRRSRFKGMRVFKLRSRSSRFPPPCLLRHVFSIWVSLTTVTLCKWPLCHSCTYRGEKAAAACDKRWPFMVGCQRWEILPESMCDTDLDSEMGSFRGYRTSACYVKNIGKAFNVFFNIFIILDLTGAYSRTLGLALRSSVIPDSSSTSHTVVSECSWRLLTVARWNWS